MTHLEMAEALDSMERSVTSWEADFLASILDRLKVQHRPLTGDQAGKLEEIYNKYLGEDAGSSSGDDEVDEDDFV